MKNFNRGGGFGDKKSSGGFGRRDSGGRGGFDRRDGDRPTMHRAVCAECGDACEVPFKPMSDKPVYCSNCFKGKDDSSSRPSRGRDERPSFGDRGPRRDDRSSFGEKRMFEAVCSECGDTCEVPFKPSSGKPVYCSECFGKTENAKPAGNRGGGNDQFDVLNKKLDSILHLLSSANGVAPKGKKEEPKKEEIKKAVKEVVKEVEKVEPAKAAKKVAPKKATVAKKVAAPKKAVKAKKK